MQSGTVMADGRRPQLAWGKLVRLGESTESALFLINSECTVGRRKGCDLSFPVNKLLSGDHCKITQDQTSGQAWLEDTSTNGTVINMSKMLKKQRHPLQNGDVIHFVYRKNEPEQNIAYVYHSVSPKLSSSQDTEVNDEEGEQSGSALMDPIDPDVDPEPVEPVTLPCEPQEVQLGFGFEESQPSTSYNISLTAFTDLRPAEPTVEPPAAQRDQDESEEPERKRQKTVDPKRETKSSDQMEESLSCIICQDLLHDCVSLQPCMHTFCAACYSEWMERSSLCPTCRCPVERICKNHILNNLVEAYLLQHPEKCRSEEELRCMDVRNKISQDMLQPKVERYCSDEEGSSDYLFDLSDNDSDTSDLSQPYLTCRQCPGYRKEVSSAPWICNPTQEVEPAPADGPSTSTHSTGWEEFQCGPYGGHLICTCCLQPMPDRRVEHVGTGPSPQHCVVCQRPFCHLYWGCQRVGCHGCLARFTDLDLTDKCLDGVLNNNHYESEILQNYLSSKGKTWRELLQDTLLSVQEGHYHLSDFRISSNSFLCYCCGLRFFKELAYIYRENIAAADLPVGVTSRPNCYWGRNCRTQIKAHHAMKFNHICEQTRFKH